MSSFRFLYLLVLVSVCSSWACEKVPLTAPTDSEISLSTTSNIVPVNGSVEITATVIESAGTAVQNGTTVIFTSDFGRMDPAEAKTQNGRATVRFVANGQSGTARVNAYSGAASTTGTPPGTLTLLVGGAAAGRLTLRAEPPNIPQSGGTVQIIASVTDTNGNALAGAPVTFTVGGTGTATGTGILSNPSAVTDQNGNARTALTTTQTADVTGTVATATAPAVTATVTVNVLAAPSVTLGCPTGTQQVGVAVSCDITPTSTTSPIQNVTVNWGDSTGEQAAGNVTGKTTVVHTYTSPGTYSVTASATDLNGQRGTAIASIVVNRVLPNVTLTVPSTGTAGVAVAMSIAPAGTQAQLITGVVVSFGDGTSRSFGQLTSTQGFTKTYSADGGYTVTATATDASGQQSTTSQAIVISRATAPVVTLAPAAPTTSTTINRNQPANFLVGATLGVTPYRSVTVTMTDGTVLYSGTTVGNFVYTFLGSGNTVLTAVVVDAAGTEGRTQLAVFINP